MAKLVQKVEPTEPTYIIEITQSELDMVVGLANDLSDPARKVRMFYDGDTKDYVVLTAKGREALLGLVRLDPQQADNYDYEDYWEYKHVEDSDSELDGRPEDRGLYT